MRKAQRMELIHVSRIQGHASVKMAGLEKNATLVSSFKNSNFQEKLKNDFISLVQILTCALFSNGLQFSSNFLCTSKYVFAIYH